MDVLFNLECFDAAAPSDTASDATYRAGFDAGLIAGKKAATDEAVSLKRDLVQAVMAISCTYEKARVDVISSLSPLLKELAETILPHCVAQGFAAQIAALILTRFRSGQGTKIRIYVNPRQVEPLIAATRSLADKVIISSDPSLSVYGAWLRQEQTEVYLDIDQHLAEIADLISGITHSQQEGINYG